MTVAADDRFCVTCGAAINVADRPASTPTDEGWLVGETQRRVPQPPPPTPPRRRSGRWLAGMVALVVLAAIAATAVWAVIPRRTSASVPPVSPSPSPSPPPSASPSASPSPSPSGPPALDVLYQRVQDGVLKVETRDCTGSYFGSGFLVGADRLVTAAHVVRGMTTIQVDAADGPVAATVLGEDDQLDVALVRLPHAATGHDFTLASTASDPGTRVAAIGFPVTGEKSLTAGTVSALDRSITLDTGVIEQHLIQIDVAINPGNSGGPLLDPYGVVVGILSASRTGAQGVNYAASASLAAPLIATWTSAPNPPPSPSCAAPSPSPSTAGATPSVAVGRAQQLASALAAHDWTAARAIDPSLGSDASLQTGYGHLTRSDIDSSDETPTAGGSDLRLLMRAQEDPDAGLQTSYYCTRWTYHIDGTVSQHAVVRLARYPGYVDQPPDGSDLASACRWTSLG